MGKTISGVVAGIFLFSALTPLTSNAQQIGEKMPGFEEEKVVHNEISYHKGDHIRIQVFYDQKNLSRKVVAYISCGKERIPFAYLKKENWYFDFKSPNHLGGFLQEPDGAIDLTTKKEIIFPYVRCPEDS